MDPKNLNAFHFYHFLPSLEGGGAEKVALTYHRALLKKGYSSTILLLKERIAYDVNDITDSIVILSKNHRLTLIKQID